MAVTHDRGPATPPCAGGVARALFDALCSQAGYDGAIRTVSSLLHHASAATTERYLGLSTEQERRDQMTRGKPFLSAMVDSENVTPLRKAE